ncbi:hypothetical protein MNB_SM-5-666 [hydrothermal vent metagenome]|uniref:Outer membrane efflux protein n=1 Tax=hydrothermal vent metagenome TaxID=652676 RepID=A0A1W1CQK7_9ZZZZ
MIKKIVALSLLAFSAHADMTSFYRDALKHLEYETSYNLYATANKTSQNAVTYSKYANFSLDGTYSKTYTQHLPTSSGSFNTTEISLHDTLDLFGKNNYKIQMLHLDMISQKSKLASKKEQLFISLVNMVSLYNKTQMQLKIHQEFYEKQQKIYKKLKDLAQNGDITALDILRFKNTLTTLQTKIVAQTQGLAKMKAKLHLYAPKQTIPKLTQTQLLYTKKDFLAHNPQATINSLDAQKLLAQSQGVEKQYMPTVTLGVNYQKLDDPTSYGDNHSFDIAVQIPLNGANFKDAQALKVKAMNKQTQGIAYKIQRENQYITEYQAYINAKNQLAILENSLKDFKKSEKTIEQAYLKQYVNFSTYLQVLKQTLDVKNQIITMQTTQHLEATIINAIASGKIYE